MGDKNDSTSYLNQFFDNLGKSLGLEDNEQATEQGSTNLSSDLEEEVEKLNLSQEDEKEVRDMIKDIPDLIDNNRGSFGTVQDNFPPLKKKAGLRTKIREYGGKYVGIQKEGVALELFLLGAFLSLAGNVKPILKYVGAPIFIKVGYQNSRILQKILSEPEIQKYTKINPEELSGKGSTK